MSHVRMSHVTQINLSCRTSRTSYLNTILLVEECVTSHISMSLVARINASCHIVERVMSHIANVVSCHGTKLRYMWLNKISVVQYETA